MAITISGENNNDRILASDGVIDQISGINIVGVLTATTFSGDFIGNLTGNVTGNINNSTLLLQTGGTERVRIDSGGRIGLGIDNPGSYFASYNRVVMGRPNDSGSMTIVSAPTYGGYIAFADGTSGNQAYRGLITYAHGQDAMVFNTAATERLRITNSGQVGIGSAIPADHLDVHGNSIFGAQSTADAQVQLGRRYSGNRNAYIDLVGDDTYYDYGFRIIRKNTGANAESQISHRGTGDFTISANEAAPIRFTTQGGERLRITSAGKVGINTDNPSQHLTVRGTILKTRSDSGLGLIYLQQDGSYNGQIAINQNGGVTRTLLHSAGDSYFNGGNLLVGTTSGNQNNKIIARLSNASLPNTSTASVILAENNANSWITIGSAASSYGGILFADSGSADIGQIRYLHGDNRMEFIVNTSERARITSDGKFGIGNFTSGTAVSQALHVKGSAPAIFLEHTGGYDMTLTTSDGMGMNGITVNGGFLSLAYNNKNIVMCRTGGYVGINTTAPSTPLELYTAASAAWKFRINTSVSDGAGLYQRANGDFEMVLRDASNNNNFVSGNSGGLEFSTSGTEKLRITSGGQVNIGGEYTETSYALSVTGKFRVKRQEADIWMESTGANKIWRILGSTGGSTHMFRIYDQSVGQDRLDVDSSGRVLIGTLNNSNGHIAASKLAVHGHLAIFKDSGGDNAGVNSHQIKFVTQSGSIAEIQATSAGGGGPSGRGGYLSLFAKPNNNSTLKEMLRVSDAFVLLLRENTSLEGGQLAFARASDNTAYWMLDSYGSSSTPDFRIHAGGSSHFSINSSGQWVDAPPGTVIQVAYGRYDPNTDSYATISQDTKARSPAYAEITPLRSDSKLVIQAKCHTRMQNAYGASFGIDYSTDSGSSWTALSGMVNRNGSSLDFFYKGEARNHHYTSHMTTYIDSFSGSRRFSPWGQGWGTGTWELSYGHGEHSVVIFEIAT